MTWNNPQTVAELADSIARGFPFHSTRFAIEGHVVAVLSGHPFPEASRVHPLTNTVAEGAEWAEDNYRNAADRSQARTYHPDVVSYYIRDRRTNRAMAGAQENGTVLDDITAVRPDLRSSTVRALRDAMETRAALRIQP